MTTGNIWKKSLNNVKTIKKCEKNEMYLRVKMKEKQPRQPKKKKLNAFSSCVTFLKEFFSFFLSWADGTEKGKKETSKEWQ